jgi:hypothetical protein
MLSIFVLADGTRMQVVWSEHPRIDDANSLVFDVSVDGTPVMVHITEEASGLEDPPIPWTV